MHRSRAVQEGDRLPSTKSAELWDRALSLAGSPASWWGPARSLSLPLLDPVAHAELPNRKPNRHFRIKEVPESARKPIANQGVQDRDCFEMLAPLAAVQNVIECSNIAKIPLHLELVAVSARPPNDLGLCRAGARAAHPHVGSRPWLGGSSTGLHVAGDLPSFRLRIPIRGPNVARKAIVILVNHSIAAGQVDLSSRLQGWTTLTVLVRFSG